MAESKNELTAVATCPYLRQSLEMKLLGNVKGKKGRRGLSLRTSCFFRLAIATDLCSVLLDRVRRT